MRIVHVLGSVGVFFGGLHSFFVSRMRVGVSEDAKIV